MDSTFHAEELGVRRLSVKAKVVPDDGAQRYPQRKSQFLAR